MYTLGYLLRDFVWLVCRLLVKKNGGQFEPLAGLSVVITIFTTLLCACLVWVCHIFHDGNGDDDDGFEKDGRAIYLPSLYSARWLVEINFAIVNWLMTIWKSTPTVQEGQMNYLCTFYAAFPWKYRWDVDHQWSMTEWCMMWNTSFPILSSGGEGRERRSSSESSTR